MAMAEPPPRPDEVLEGLDFEMDDILLVDLTGKGHDEMIATVLSGAAVDVTVLNDKDLSSLRGWIREELLKRGEMEYDDRAKMSADGELLHSTWIACHTEFWKRAQERKPK